MPKLEILLEFVAAQPKEPLPRYALGMEYRSRGRAEEAVSTFRELVSTCPDYVPTYLMLAQTLIGLGRRDEARLVLERGVAVARSARQHHAATEMEEALDAIAEP